MKNFNIFTSNRLEILIEKLYTSLKTPILNPFEKEIIVVQSKGMEKFLSLNLASQLGIASNIDFLYPNSMIDFCLEKAGVKKDKIWKYNVDKYAWTLIDIIPQFYGNVVFEDVFSYVEENKNINKEKLYQFSLKVSELFQQYQIFRPQWIVDWDNRLEDNNWQALLWNRLHEKVGLENNINLMQELLDRYGLDNSVLNNLPKRISVFGIFSLPKIYLESLSFFSNSSEINFYLLNPCKEYWGDIIPIKRKDKIESKSNENLFFETGNQLLASFGDSGKNFFDQINEYHPNIYDESFEEPKDLSLLSKIQSSILNLRDPINYEKEEIDNNDLSIRIHSCHGPMREMEVLRDNILMVLENDNSINFGDILVMIPDIEKYSPYINSVFSRRIDGKRIPFSIADKSLKSDNNAAIAFSKILSLFKSRFEASIVTGIFEEKIVYSNFGLNEEDIVIVREWIIGLDIAWGLDKDFKAGLNLPKDDTSTWKKGIDSLVLGHALKTDELTFFNDLLPYQEIETGEIDILSGFIGFYDLLRHFSLKILNKEYKVDEWIDIFYELIDSFLSFDSTFEFEVISLKDILRGIKDEAEESGVEADVTFGVIYERVESIILSTIQNSGFLDGRITFCAMLPMRSIPFKMILLSGMNEKDFPREYTSPAFDLIVNNKKRGDRNVRDDDRYLFLETLISARKYFYITFTGKDYKTDTLIPPSVVVSELIDYIGNNFYIKNRDKNYIKKRILRDHKAPSFSNEYFEYDNFLEADLNNKNFSFSKRMMDLSKSVETDEIADDLFFDLPIKDENREKIIDLTSFINFFKNPQKFYLLYNNIETGIKHNTFKDREVFKPDGLERFLTSNKILDLAIENENKVDIDKYLKSKNLVPFGKTGEIYIEELKNNVLKFHLKLEDFILNPQKIILNQNIDDWLLKGSIKIYDNKLILFRYGKISPENLIETFIKHILLLSLKTSGVIEQSMFFGIDGSKTETAIFCDTKSYEKYLINLIKIYEEGISKPINFHPKLSYKYCNILLKSAKNNKENIDDKLRLDALKKTENEMNNKISFTDYSWVNRCFRGQNFLTDEFINISEKIFMPILLNIEK